MHRSRNLLNLRPDPCGQLTPSLSLSSSSQNRPTDLSVGLALPRTFAAVAVTAAAMTTAAAAAAATIVTATVVTAAAATTVTAVALFSRGKRGTPLAAALPAGGATGADAASAAIAAYQRLRYQ